MIVAGPVFTPSKLVRERYKPNLELMFKSLMANQQFYDSSMEQLGKRANANPGDVEFRDKVMKEYEDLSEQITNDYMKKGVNEGQQSLRNALRKIKKDIQPGGRYYELEKNYKIATEAMKEQKKRVREGKLTQASYYESTLHPISEHKTFDEDGNISTLNLMERQDAINFDEFADKFMNHKSKELTELGYTKSYDGSGNILWIKRGTEGIKQEELERELATAYRNAAMQTGQLVDEYNYLKRRGVISDEAVISDVRDELMGKKDITLNRLEALRAGKATDDLLQFATKETLTSDKPSAIKWRNETIKQFENAIENVNEQLDIYEKAEENPKAMSNLAANNWINQYTLDLAEPYASAKAYMDRTVDMETTRDWSSYWANRKAIARSNRKADGIYDLVKNTMTDPTTNVLAYSTGNKVMKTFDELSNAGEKGVSQPSFFTALTGIGDEGSFMRQEDGNNKKLFSFNTSKEQDWEGLTIADMVTRMLTFNKQDPSKVAKLLFDTDESKLSERQTKGNKVVKRIIKDEFNSYIKENPNIVLNGVRLGDISETGNKQKWQESAVSWLGSLKSMSEVNVVYKEFPNEGAQSKETSQVAGKLGDNGLWQLGDGLINKTVAIFNEDGSVETMPSEQWVASAEAHTTIVGSGKSQKTIAGINSAKAYGFVDAVNPLNIPSGTLVNFTFVDGSRQNVVLMNKFNEDNSYFNLVNNLASDHYALTETQGWKETGAAGPDGTRVVVKLVPEIVFKGGQTVVDSKIQYKYIDDEGKQVGEIKVGRYNDLVKQIEADNPYRIGGNANIEYLQEVNLYDDE